MPPDPVISHWGLVVSTQLGVPRAKPGFSCSNNGRLIVFVAASRYQTGITVAKDTVLITTVVAVPAMIGVALLLT